MVRRLVVRLAGVLLAAWLLTVLPSPSDAVPLPLKNVLVASASIVYLGKLLYDTLFFDHFQF